RHGFRLRAGGMKIENHAGARFGESFDAASADAARSSGHENDVIVKIHSGVRLAVLLEKGQCFWREDLVRPETAPPRVKRNSPESVKSIALDTFHEEVLYHHRN